MAMLRLRGRKPGGAVLPPRVTPAVLAEPLLPLEPYRADGTLIWAHAPRLEVAGLPAGPVPGGTVLVPGITLHHDADPGQVGLSPAGDQAGVTVTAAGGGFFSVAVALPDAGAHAPGRHSLIGIAADLRSRVQLTVTLRLNLRAGPNLEQSLKPATWTGDIAGACFDLAHLLSDHHPVTDAWIDIILSPVPRGAVTLRAVTLIHRRRATL